MSVYELSAILNGPHRGIALLCLQIQKIWSNATVSKGVGYSLLVCIFVFGKSLRLCRYYKKTGIEMQ